MSGMAEILDENTRLRQASADKDALLAERTRAADALAEKNAALGSEGELLTAKNASLTHEIERLTKHFALLERSQGSPTAASGRPGATSSSRPINSAAPVLGARNRASGPHQSPSSSPGPCAQTDCSPSSS